jgi:dipicolinate synthase subunit A
MDTTKSFLVAGGDLRQVYLAEKLASKDNIVYAIGFDENISFSDGICQLENTIMLTDRVDYIVLPLPVSTDGVMVNAPFCRQCIPLNSLTTVLKDGGIVFGGKFNNASRKIFANSRIDTIDYFDREELNVLNAVPTAEGAVQIAMEELATTIFGQKILITGFGRITKVLVKILIGLGADVTIAARKYSDISWAEIYGCKGIHISQLKENISEFTVIFNTVPALIFDEKILKLVNKDVLIIDLASKPGGVDFETAGVLGVKVVWALSLPGKVAPISSGEIIAYTILNILNERGMADD